MPLSSVLGANSAIRPGVCTSSTRPSVPYTGQLIFETDTNRLVIYNGSSWIYVVDTDTPPALELITTQTIGSAASSVTVSNCFSATYDNYRIIVTGGVGSVGEDVINMTLGSTTTGYYWSRVGRSWTNVDASTASANTTSWRIGGSSTQSIYMIADVTGPFLAEETAFSSTYLYTSTGAAGGGNFAWGYLNNTTSYTAFTLTSAGGTLTGGTIRVYGYRNS
jgi:hypothetical protein